MSPEEKDHRVTAEKSGYVQEALDQLRANLIELRESLGYWGQFCVDKQDLLSRVENWQFNSWRTSEDILRAGD